MLEVPQLVRVSSTSPAWIQPQYMQQHIGFSINSMFRGSFSEMIKNVVIRQGGTLIRVWQADSVCWNSCVHQL
jgi:hypothetical protein